MEQITSFKNIKWFRKNVFWLLIISGYATLKISWKIWLIELERQYLLDIDSDDTEGVNVGEMSRRFISNLKQAHIYSYHFNQQQLCACQTIDEMSFFFKTFFTCVCLRSLMNKPKNLAAVCLSIYRNPTLFALAVNRCIRLNFPKDIQKFRQ